MGSGDRRRGCGCTGCLGTVFSMGVSVVLFAVVGLVPLVGVVGGQSAPNAAAVAAFNACPAVVEALGPVEKAPYSLGCGESSSGGGRSQASWTIDVRGPKGKASGHYTATRLGGDAWQVQSAVLKTAAGQTLVAVPCPAPPPVTPAPRPKPERPQKPDRGAKSGKRPR